jgi:hypothetical protein
MFVSSSNAGNPFEVELGGALTAPFLDPADNIYGAPINAARVGSVGTPTPARPLVDVGLVRPNPFNPETLVPITLSSRAYVEADVLDARGQLVRTLLSAQLDPGVRVLRWDGRDVHSTSVASGVYLLRVRAQDQTVVRKMAIVR